MVWTSHNYSDMCSLYFRIRYSVINDCVLSTRHENRIFLLLKTVINFLSTWISIEICTEWRKSHLTLRQDINWPLLIRHTSWLLEKFRVPSFSTDTLSNSFQTLAHPVSQIRGSVVRAACRFFNIECEMASEPLCIHKRTLHEHINGCAAAAITFIKMSTLFI